MLYLEDYLEMIEHLPQELRDRFTEMREMDLQVQNAMDSLDSRVKEFFAACKKMKQSERDSEFEKIDQDYYKALEDADEKVHIANQIYELLERYIRKLDQELQKFKMELEADNAGITEILEQRSYDLDKAQSVMLPLTNSNNIKVEKRKLAQISTSFGYPNDKQIEKTDKVLSSLANEVMRETISSNRINLAGQSPLLNNSSNNLTNSIPEKTVILSQPKANPFGGGNALAAAASQAIAATQQSLKRTSSQSQSTLIQQGRRSASLKASYEAINSGLPSLKEFNISPRDMATLQSVSPSSTNVISSPMEPKTKMKKTSRSSTISQPIETSLVMEDSEDSSAVEGDGNDNIDWAYDPNEPRYCICNQVSYGDMVACDNTDCPFEWFHYQCVGISQPPKGKWYCPQCTSSMKRRGRKDR